MVIGGILEVLKSEIHDTDDDEGCSTENLVRMWKKR